MIYSTKTDVFSKVHVYTESDHVYTEDEHVYTEDEHVYTEDEHVSDTGALTLSQMRPLRAANEAKAETHMKRQLYVYGRQR